jgi:hypothetical protein
MFEMLMTSEEEEFFFEEHWENSPMFIFAEGRCRFKKIINHEDVDEMLATWDFESLGVRGYIDGQFQEISIPKTEASFPVKEAYRRYGKGTVLTINNLRNSWNPIKKLCDILEKDLHSFRTTASLYLFHSSKESISLSTNSSNRILLYITGSVGIKIYRPKDRSSRFLKDFSEVGDCTELTLHEFVGVTGDFVYVPPSHRYEFILPKNSPAVILELSFESYSWEHLLQRITGLLEDREQLMKKSIPLDWMKNAQISLSEDEKEIQGKLQDKFSDPSLLNSIMRK